MSREYGKSAPFQTISEACRTTGLSQYALRKGCKNGSIPYLKVGNKYMIDVPELMKLLHKESTPPVRGNTQTGLTDMTRNSATVSGSAPHHLSLKRANDFGNKDSIPHKNFFVNRQEENIMDKVDLIESVATVRTLAVVLDEQIELIAAYPEESLNNSVRLSGILLEKLDVLCEQLNAPAK